MTSTNKEKPDSSENYSDEDSNSKKSVPDPLNQDGSLEEVVLFQNPAVTNFNEVGYSALKSDFRSKMDASIHSIVNECVGVLHRDPREYHPFYLRVHKWIAIGQHYHFITISDRTVSSMWTSYDNYAAQQYKSYEDNPNDFKFEGEHSPYLTYVLTQKVILAGAEVNPIRDEEQVAKQFSDLNSLVAKLRCDANPRLNFRTNLKRRLEFFEHCKDMRYPGDTIKLMNLWALLLSPRPTHKSLKGNLTEEEKRDKVLKSKFCRLQKKIEEDMMPEEERKRRKLERFLKASAYVASKPKEFHEAKRERDKERWKKRREHLTEEQRKLKNQKLSKLVKGYTGEKLQKFRERSKKTLKKYLDKVKAQDPEKIKAGYIRNNRKRMEKILKTETEEERDERLLYQRVAQAKFLAKKKMREEGGYTEEAVQRRLEEVEAIERAKPKPSRAYVYKPKPRKKSSNQQDTEELSMGESEIPPPPIPPSDHSVHSSEPVPMEIKPCLTLFSNVNPFEVESTQPKRRGRPPRRLLSLLSPAQPSAPMPSILLPIPAPVTDIQNRVDLSGSIHTSNPTVPPPPPSNWNCYSADPSLDDVSGPATSPGISSNTFFDDDYDDDRDSIAPLLSPPSQEPGPTLKDDMCDVTSRKNPSPNESFQESTKPEEILMDQKVDAASTPKEALQLARPTHSSPAPKLSRISPSKASHICDECGRLFSKQSLLTHHKKKYHNTEVNKLECSECNLSYVSTAALWDHFAVCHTANKDSSSGPGRPKVEKPAKIRKRKKPPRIEIEKPKKISDYRQTLEPNVCPHCNKSFHQKSTLLDHIRRAHEQVGTHTCPECGSDLQYKAKLWRHRVERHGKDLPPPEGLPLVICEFCSEVVLRGYAEHVKKKHPEHAAKFSFQKVKDEKTGKLVIHCPHSDCSSKLSNEKQLKQHLKKHDDPSYNNRPRPPPKPKRQQEQKPRRQAPKRRPTKRDTFTCTECDKTFSRRFHLTRHYHTVHTFGDLPRKLESQNLIRVESKSQHNLKCNAVCLLCEIELSTPMAIKAHFVTEHSKELKEALVNLVECTFCHDKFPDKTQLQDHLISSHKEDIFSCQYCGEIKCSKVQLDMHEFIKHLQQDGNERPGVCSVCKAVFPNRNAVWEHVRDTHPSNYFPCVAPSCEAKYYSNDTIWNHMTKCKEANECAGDIDEIRKIVEKLLKTLVCCLECDKVFKYHWLDTHRKMSHGIARNMGTTCEHCGLICRQQSFYIAHCNFAHNVQLEELVKVAPPERPKRKKKITLESGAEDDDDETEDEEDDWNDYSSDGDDYEKKTKKKKVGSRRSFTPKTVEVDKATRTSARLQSKGRGKRGRSCMTMEINVEGEKRLVIKLVRLTEEDINRFLGRSQIKIEMQDDDYGADEEVEVKYCPKECING